MSDRPAERPDRRATPPDLPGPVAGPAPAGLRLDDLTVVLGGATVLREVCLDVAHGSMTVVVGPSGAGKTTLLRAVVGLAPLTRGTVVLDGRELTRVATHRRRIGVVFQEPRLFPDVDVADNVAFALRLARVPRRQRRARAAALLEEVGLPGADERRVTDLSGGERQRVALARALAAEPQLLLLDEPLAAVDPPRRAELRELIARTRRDRGLTAVHVTHDRLEAAELADELVLVDCGRVVERGRPPQLFERPTTVFAAGFLGSANVLHGEVCDGRLLTSAGAVPVAAPDGPATVTIRPERIRLGQGDLRATVTGCVFQGDHVRVTLRAGDLELVARTDVGGAPPVGTTVAADLPRAHLWPLDHTLEVPQPARPMPTADRRAAS